MEGERGTERVCERVRERERQVERLAELTDQRAKAGTIQ